MDEPRDPQIEKIMKQMKLKEPGEGDLKNYLEEVHAKIERTQKPSFFGFQTAFFFIVVVGFIFGIAYFLNMNEAGKETALSEKTAPTQQQISRQKSLSLEEEMQVLEAFSEEANMDSSDIFGDEEAVDEIVFLDEVELNLSTSPLTA